MSLKIIFAHDLNGGIGQNNDLPWKHPPDYAWFKAHTLHTTIVMGRKTADSLTKALPNRRNLVLTRHTYERVGFSVSSLEEIFEKAKNESIYIVGGTEIYTIFWPYTRDVYRTVIHGKHDCDTFFSPSFSALTLHNRTELEASETYAAATFEHWINPTPQAFPT